MKVEVTDLKRLLQSPVPKGYIEYVERVGPAIKKRGFDPKTLCVLNLELRDVDRTGWTKNRFFLSGDGCGNYYFVSTEKTEDPNRVLLWSHDPPGIEDAAKGLAVFLDTAIQENPVVDSLQPGSLCIARTAVVGESILSPISLNDWQQAVASCDGVRYQAYCSVTNPFTGKSMRVEQRGVAIAECGGKNVILRLHNGRIEGDYTSDVRPIAEALASALKAQLRVRAR